ncbi:MAG: hypothetical protein ACM31C_26420 [Acidobacteriota bacterium]
MEIVIALCIGLAIASIKPISRTVGEARDRARARRRMREGEDAVSDLALVTVTGTVRVLGEPLVAPLSGTPCVAHRSRARTFKHDSPVFARKLVAEEVREAAIAFALATGDGELIVDGEHVELAIKPTPVEVRSADREIAFMRDVGLTKDYANTSFDEIVITAGMTITVHGIAQVEPTAAGAGETDFREAPSRTRITGDDAHPLTISEA